MRPMAEPIALPAVALREKSAPAAELTMDAAAAEPEARESKAECVVGEKEAGVEVCEPDLSLWTVADDEQK